MIGSTEALHVFIGNRPGHVRVGSTGEVLPGFEAKIVDDEGQEVGVDEVGTLLVKGDSPLLLEQTPQKPADHARRMAQHR